MDVSLSSLKQELQQAQELEAKRRNENDSKLRAVAQHMDYDQFRQMVLGANLKCSKTGELTSLQSAQGDRSLNTVYRQEGTAGQTTLQRVETGEIRTLTEFRRRWNGGERWETLKLSSPYLSEIFSTGIDCDYVADLVSLAYTGLVTHDYPCEPEEWREMWTLVSQCSGWAQGARMLSRKEKERMEEVRRILEDK